MNLTRIQIIILLGALIITIVFVKLMYDMSSAMSEMTHHVGAISQDVAGMRASMDDITGNMVKMSDSMERVEASMRGMGKAVTQIGRASCRERV